MQNMIRLPWNRLLFLSLTLVLACGCPARKASRKSGAQPGSGQGEAAGGGTGDRTVLARVGSRIITVQDVLDEIAQQSSYVRMRYTSLEQRKNLLQQMIRFEVLVQEARRRHLESDPEVVRRVKRVMVNRLMERLQGELVKMEDITDAEVQAYYEKNIEMYKQPEMVRASQVVVKTRAEAEQVLQKARTKPKEPRVFAELVNAHSIDPTSKVRRGDLDFFTRDTDKLPRPVVEAAFGIQEMWELAGPVQTDQGFVVLMKTGLRPAIDRPLEQERAQIRNRLYNERRLDATERYVERLKSKANLQIDEGNLARVRVKAEPGPPTPRGQLRPGGEGR